LWHALEHGEPLAAAFREPGRWHPFPGLYRVGLLDHVERALQDTRRALHDLLDEAGAVALPLPADWDTSRDLNQRTDSP